MTRTLTEKAVVGRRVELAYYRDLKTDGDKATYRLGIITGVDGGVWIRLDGTRCNLRSPVDYEGLRYLDEVVPVPALPVGRFQPTAQDMAGVWEGVPLATVGPDGEDLILLTDDLEKARAAAAAYDAEVGVDVASVDYNALRSYWAVFEWEPEDSESLWNVRWDAEQGDDQAVHVYYLPA